MRIFLLLLLFFCVNKVIGQEVNSVEDAKQIAQKALDNVSKNINLSKQQIKQLSIYVRNLQNSQSNLKNQIEKLQNQQKQAKQQLEKDSDLFKKYIIEQNKAEQKYKLAKKQFVHITSALEYMQLTPPPILVAQPQTIYKTIRGTEIIQIIVPKVKQEIDNYNSVLNALKQSIANSNIQKNQLIASLNIYKINTEKLNMLLHLTQINEQKSNQKIIQTHQTIDNLETKSQSLEKFLNIVNKQKTNELLATKKLELLNKLKKLPNFTIFKGKLNLPVQGKVLKNYYTDKNSNKKGETLLALTSNKVKASSAGLIEYAGDFRSYGKIVIINMGSNYYMILSGFKELFVESNKFIEKNTILGLVDINKTIYAELKFGSESVNIEPWWLTS